MYNVERGFKMEFEKVSPEQAQQWDDDETLDKVNEWKGFKEGETMGGGLITRIYVHHESEAVWLVFNVEGNLFERGIPYS